MTAAALPTPDAQTSRPPRGEARRDALTRAALAVIARVGPDGLTHRLVAAEAGLPLAATTYWFASKEDMVRAALEHAADRDLEHLEEVMRAASRDWTIATLADELADGVERSCTDRRENAMVDCALWVEALRRPDLRPIAERWIADYADILGEVLRNAGLPGTHDDAELLGAAIDGLISHALVASGPFDRAAVVRRLERLVAALAG
jgi:DNA-binding transcriptional regulator YbjK